MLEILQFIFSSPWIFAGTLILSFPALLAWAALIKGAVAIVAVVRGGNSTVNIK